MKRDSRAVSRGGKERVFEELRGDGPLLGVHLQAAQSEVPQSWLRERRHWRWFCSLSDLQEKNNNIITEGHLTSCTKFHALLCHPYLENQLELVLDIVRPSPGWLGSGHLDDDTANAPHITLPPIPCGGAFLSGTSTYNLSVVEHCMMGGLG